MYRGKGGDLHVDLRRIIHRIIRATPFFSIVRFQMLVTFFGGFFL